MKSLIASRRGPARRGRPRHRARQTVAPGNTAPEHGRARHRGHLRSGDRPGRNANQRRPDRPATLVPDRTRPRPSRPQPSTGESYPPCSRTVTDNCTQTYEARRRAALRYRAGLSGAVPNPLTGGLRRSAG